MELIKKNFISIIVAVAPLAIIGWLFRFISVERLSQRENVLIGLLLTIFSVLFSWLISHIYFDCQSGKNYISEGWKRLIEDAKKRKKFEETLSDFDQGDSQQTQYNFLKEEINKLKHHFRSTTVPVPDNSLTQVEIKNHRKDIKTKCLNCATELCYQQRPMSNSYKPMDCASCGTSFIARWNESKGFYLETRKNTVEVFNCPACDKTQRCEIDSLVNSSLIMECLECKNKIKVYRMQKGLKLFILGNAAPQPKEISQSSLNQELIRLIRVKKAAKINNTHKEETAANLPLAKK